MNRQTGVEMCEVFFFKEDWCTYKMGLIPSTLGSQDLTFSPWCDELVCFGELLLSTVALVSRGRFPAGKLHCRLRKELKLAAHL